MGSTVVIIALWLAFAATHMLLSSQRLRPRLVGVLGAPAFLGLYSVVALAIFVPLVSTYIAERHAGPLLWALPVGLVLRWLLYGLMAAAFVLVLAGLLQPSPAGFMGGDVQVRGVDRLCRHPLFMGFGLFGALHLVWNGFASDVAFFAGFPLFALVGCAHQDRRKLANLGAEYAAWHAETPFLPFTGRQTLRGLRELGWRTPLAGLALTVALRLLHGPLFR